MNILERKSYLERRKEAIDTLLSLGIGDFCEFSIPDGQYGAFRAALNREAGEKKFSMQKGESADTFTNFQILRIC